MSGIQNIPAPDDDSNEPNEGLGSHSGVPENLDNKDEAKRINDAEDLTQKDNVPTGFENVPRDDSERTDIEQPANIEPH